MKRFKCLVFVDDDYPTNFYHNEIAEEAEIAEKLVFFRDAVDALAYLKERKENSLEPPEIIFLDINMPKINGWEFADIYGREIGNNNSKIIVLTTSVNPADKEKADNNKWVNGFLSKPLSLSLFNRLREEYL